MIPPQNQSHYPRWLSHRQPPCLHFYVGEIGYIRIHEILIKENDGLSLLKQLQGLMRRGVLRLLVNGVIMSHLRYK